MQKIATIIAVLVVAVAAFVGGRMSVNYRPLVAFERAYVSCIESVAFEYRDKIRAEFRRAELEWEAKHSPYRWPVRAAIYRSYERPNFEDYFERIASTRSDYPAYTQRRDDCVRKAAAG
jgi:hypothetical protein